MNTRCKTISDAVLQKNTIVECQTVVFVREKYRIFGLKRSEFILIRLGVKVKLFTNKAHRFGVECMKNGLNRAPRCKIRDKSDKERSHCT